jgi:hypothetical protein
MVGGFLRSLYLFKSPQKVNEVLGFFLNQIYESLSNLIFYKNILLLKMFKHYTQPLEN